jgi:site-specific recombinase XerD
VKRACERAGVSPFSPNRLRHSAATAIRKGFGVEAAQVVLGHSQVLTTQIYAERDQDLGRGVAAEIG